MEHAAIVRVNRLEDAAGAAVVDEERLRVGARVACAVCSPALVAREPDAVGVKSSATERRSS